MASQKLKHWPSCGPLHFPGVVLGSPWLHFVDNAAALSTLVSGSSSVESGDLISGLTWSLVAGLRCLPWFDRVDTHSNPVDGLSRGKLKGTWVLEPLCFPSLQPPTPPRCSLLGAGCGGCGPSGGYRSVTIRIPVRGDARLRSVAGLPSGGVCAMAGVCRGGKQSLVAGTLAPPTRTARVPTP